ncbi:MAG: ATPase P [bacterium]|jgi:soluble P-type ATPase|nr:ATPase P [bacterium]
MIEIEIPGFGNLSLQHLVLDYNGTLACDGKLLEGVRERLSVLSENIDVHVITADTFGLVRTEMNGTPCHIEILGRSNEAAQKENFIRTLGAESVVAIGNGNNDQLMLKKARLSIAIMGHEGCAVAALQAADIVVTDINAGLDLLIAPLRCKATLRF